jgi:hypothetical protein
MDIMRQNLECRGAPALGDHSIMPILRYYHLLTDNQKISVALIGV